MPDFLGCSRRATAPFFVFQVKQPYRPFSPPVGNPPGPPPNVGNFPLPSWAEPMGRAASACQPVRLRRSPRDSRGQTGPCPAGVLCGALVSGRVLVLQCLHALHAGGLRGLPGAQQMRNMSESGRWATSHAVQVQPVGQWAGRRVPVVLGASPELTAPRPRRSRRKWRPSPAMRLFPGHRLRGEADPALPPRGAFASGFGPTPPPCPQAAPQENLVPCDVLLLRRHALWARPCSPKSVPQMVPARASGRACASVYSGLSTASHSPGRKRARVLPRLRPRRIGAWEAKEADGAPGFPGGLAPWTKGSRVVRRTRGSSVSGSGALGSQAEVG